MRAVLLSLVFVVACGGAPKSADEPAAPAEDARPDGAAAVDPGGEPAASQPKVSDQAATFDPVERAIAMMADMGKVMTAANGDCAKMATDLTAWSDANREERDRINEALETSQRFKAVEKQMQDRDDISQAIMGAINTCKGNADFVNALKQATEG